MFISSIEAMKSVWEHFVLRAPRKTFARPQFWEAEAAATPLTACPATTMTSMMTSTRIMQRATLCSAAAEEAAVRVAAV